MSNVPPATPELPKITKPKLSAFERRTINNFLEGAQEWVAANADAITTLTHVQIDRAVATIHSAADTALIWATTKFAALKL
jgi:hypothetical protein